MLWQGEKRCFDVTRRAAVARVSAGECMFMRGADACEGGREHGGVLGEGKMPVIHLAFWNPYAFASWKMAVEDGPERGEDAGLKWGYDI